MVVIYFTCSDFHHPNKKEFRKKRCNLPVSGVEAEELVGSHKPCYSTTPLSLPADSQRKPANFHGRKQPRLVNNLLTNLQEGLAYIRYACLDRTQQ